MLIRKFLTDKHTNLWTIKFIIDQIKLTLVWTTKTKQNSQLDKLS